MLIVVCVHVRRGWVVALVVQEQVELLSTTSFTHTCTSEKVACMCCA